MVSKIEKVNLGGIEQFIIIRAVDADKPVLLFLHGGPGVPEFIFMKDEIKQLEKSFVMVHWEQKGAGKSYCKDNCNLSLDNLIEDTQELSDWLSRKFSTNKIYIMGHSWGSLLGLLTVKKYPQHFHAFFGIGQVTNQYEAEKSSLQWTKEQAKISNDKKGIKLLDSLRLPSTNAQINEWDSYLRKHRKYLFKYGGTYHQKPSFLKIIKDFILAPEYTLKEKFKLIPSAIYSLKQLWSDVININLFDEIKKIDIPIYLFQGKYDYQVSTKLANKFIEQIEAPEKEIFIFENSAHSPNTEEFKKFNTIVIQLISKIESNKSLERNI